LSTVGDPPSRESFDSARLATVRDGGFSRDIYGGRWTMSDLNARPKARLLAVTASLLLALGVAACGSSDDGDSDGGDATAKQADPVSNDGSGDGTNVAAEQKKVADTMRYIRNRYNAGDGAAFCGQLSREGVAEVKDVIRSGQYAKFIKSRTCGGYVSSYSKQVVARDGLKQRPIQVLRVSVDGDKAKMVMKGGLAGYRSVVPFRFVKVDGEWKLVDPITASHRTIRVDKE